MAHIPDHELLMEADSELDPGRNAEVQRHLQECDLCRSRQAVLSLAMADALTEQRMRDLPPHAPARARLHSRLHPSPYRGLAAIAALAAALAILFTQWPSGADRIAAPRAALTPGATRLVSQQTMCAIGEESDAPPIEHAVAIEIFRKYGIHDPQPRAYEVDFLIPPDLGGSSDPHNLWPQPYKEGKWNARVKDALEDRLRTLVCRGDLDLATAQHEIAADWIGAYKKHFRTSAPLPDHVAFIKDKPWE